jgi:hypothetical protein
MMPIWSPIKKSGLPQQSTLPISLLCLNDSLRWASFYTLITARAQFGIDDKNVVAFTDGIFRTFCFTGTTSDTIIGNLVYMIGHFENLLQFVTPFAI